MTTFINLDPYFWDGDYLNNRRKRQISDKDTLEILKDVLPQTTISQKPPNIHQKSAIKKFIQSRKKHLDLACDQTQPSIQCENFKIKFYNFLPGPTQKIYVTLKILMVKETLFTEFYNLRLKLKTNATIYLENLENLDVKYKTKIESRKATSLTMITPDLKISEIIAADIFNIDPILLAGALLICFILVTLMIVVCYFCGFFKRHNRPAQSNQYFQQKNEISGCRNSGATQINNSSGKSDETSTNDSYELSNFIPSSRNTTYSKKKIYTRASRENYKIEASKFRRQHNTSIGMSCS